jgi:cell division protein FtsA
VLTGGSSQIEGAVELAEEIFGVPVRLGLPESQNGLGSQLRDASYATGVGLLKYASEHLDGAVIHDDEPTVSETTVSGHRHVREESLISKMKSWFAHQF